MSHHTTHRLAAPDPKPSLPMDPTPKPKPTTTTTTTTRPTNPDPTIPSRHSFMSNHLSKLNPYHHKVRTSQKPTNTLIDTHLQAKSMSSSVIVDSSNSKSSSLTRPNHYGQFKTKDVCKEKLKKSSKELDKKKANSEKKKESSYEGIGVKGLLEKVKDMELKNLQDGGDGIGKRQSVSFAAGRGVRRRSFCGSQAELGDIFASSGVKVVSVDMPPFMQIHAVDCARKTFDSLEKFTSKALASTIKKEFDGVYGPAWHCIVGSSFGSFVTHSVGGFMYFSMDQKLHILLFKTTVERAD